MWKTMTGEVCNSGLNHKTYNNIFGAFSEDNPQEALLEAFRARAKHMRECLEKYDREA
jgi:hypothetical protein